MKPPLFSVVWCGVVVGCGFQNSGLVSLVFDPFLPPCGVVAGVGFRVSGLHPHPPCGVGGGVV